MNTQTKMTIIAIVIVIPLTSVAVYDTNTNPQFINNNNSKLQAISSFNPLHEFSQIIGGEKIDVTLLIPVGVEPHDWEPTIKDVQQMHKSNFIIINGIGFENWINNLIENNYQGTIVDTSRQIPIKETDPHIWLNPVFASNQVGHIALAFSNLDPENEEYYMTNAAKYSEKLHLLDLKIRTDLTDCKRNFITFHDAFSYFADEYDLNQHTIVATTNSYGEITAKTLENIISIAREQNITIIFSEKTVNIKTSQIIANELGGKVLVLSSLEIVSEDNYISKMIQNLENLKEALC